MSSLKFRQRYAKQFQLFKKKVLSLQVSQDWQVELSRLFCHIQKVDFLLNYWQKLALPPSAGSLCSCRQCRSQRTCSCAQTPGRWGRARSPTTAGRPAERSSGTPSPSDTWGPRAGTAASVGTPFGRSPLFSTQGCVSLWHLWRCGGCARCCSRSGSAFAVNLLLTSLWGAPLLHWSLSRFPLRLPAFVLWMSERAPECDERLRVEAELALSHSLTLTMTLSLGSNVFSLCLWLSIPPLALSLSLFILHSTFFPSASRPLLECFPPLGRLLLCFQGSRAFLDGAQCQIRLLCQARTLGLLHLKSVCILSTAKKTRGSCSSITSYLIRDGFSHGDNAHIFDLLEGWACSSAAMEISAVVFFLRLPESAGAAAGEQNP